MSPTSPHFTRRTVISSVLMTTALARLGLVPASALQQWQWTDDQPIEGKSTRTSPALATLGDRLHMVHKGEDTTALWHSWWTAADGWSEDQTIEGHASNAPPA